VLEGGKEFIHYDKLILSPGSYPKKLPIPGFDLENVFTFRGIDDSSKVDAGEVPLATLCVYDER
jgi:NAD(P)H-nitrite reductase large subunit